MLKKIKNKKSFKIILFILILIIIFIVLAFTLFNTNKIFLSTNSVTEYYCDEGYTKVGDGPTAYCQKFKEKNYVCKAGYTALGTGSSMKCKKTDIVDADVKRKCPTGYTKSGYGSTMTCSKLVSTGYLSRVKEYSCASVKGVTKNGSKCIWKIPATTKYSCPSGYTKIGDGPNASCEKSEKPVSKYRSYCSNGTYWIERNGKCSYQKAATMKCSSGYTLSGANCVYAYKASIKNRRYTCPNGGKINSKGQCVKTKTPSYTCPTFQDIRGNLSGRTCYYTKSKTVGYTQTCNRGYLYASRCIVTAKTTKTYICGSGYKLSGTNCTKTTNAVKVMEYYCPKGYSKSGVGTNTKCEKRLSSFPSYVYTCPSGYQKYKDDSCKKEIIEPATYKSIYDTRKIQMFYTSGKISYNENYSNGNSKLPLSYNKTEPDPSVAINYWTNILDTTDFVYPKDSSTGKSLGAWPKNYQSYPARLYTTKTYNNYIWPITTTTGKYEFSYEHNGIDIIALFGTPVYSPVDGTLVYSEWGHTHNTGTDETSYSVTIKPDKIITYNGVNISEIFLTHLSGIRYRCEENKCNRKIRQGELLGFSGNASGASSLDSDTRTAGWAPHLHMSLYQEKNYDSGLSTSDIEKFYEISTGSYKEAGK